ncbi:MAG: hypothetical protein B7X77_00380, partial [Caulobacter sp. 39-67-4]
MGTSRLHHAVIAATGLYTPPHSISNTELVEAFNTFALLEAWGGPWVSARTFSKAYGLAGMRVGYGIASSAQLVGYLDRLRPPFNVTSISQAAALAALADREHLERTVALTIAERGRVEAAL